MVRGFFAPVLLVALFCIFSGQAAATLRGMQTMEQVVAEPLATPAKDGVACGTKACKPCEVCRAEGGREPWCFRPDSPECAREWANSQPLAVCGGVTCQKCEMCRSEGGRDVCYLNPSYICG